MKELVEGSVAALGWELNADLGELMERSNEVTCCKCLAYKRRPRLLGGSEFSYP